MPEPIDRDLRKLAPAFRERVDELLRRMRAQGFDPMVHEAFRSFQRAENLAGTGRGISRSMHCYGLAVDIISERNKWVPAPAFWKALEREARLLGLISGARWTRPDKPHVQAVPVSHQARVRLMTRAQREQHVARLLRGREPATRPGGTRLA